LGSAANATILVIENEIQGFEVRFLACGRCELDVVLETVA
jgi:hypothetical protein